MEKNNLIIFIVLGIIILIIIGINERNDQRVAECYADFILDESENMNLVLGNRIESERVADLMINDCGYFSGNKEENREILINNLIEGGFE